MKANKVGNWLHWQHAGKRDHHEALSTHLNPIGAARCRAGVRCRAGCQVGRARTDCRARSPVHETFLQQVLPAVITDDRTGGPVRRRGIRPIAPVRRRGIRPDDPSDALPDATDDATDALPDATDDATDPPADATDGTPDTVSPTS
jgi:hypothetical protein